MSTLELRNRLIEKIQKTEDPNLLLEASRLLDMGVTDEDIYQLNVGQKEAIREARSQIQNGDYLTDAQAAREIDEWLGK